MDKNRKYFALAGNALGGYMMFMVPYAFTSFYVAFQNSTGFSNSELGLLITIYGIAQLIMYFPGGWLADRFKTKTLLVVGFLGTSLASLGMAMLPNFKIMVILYCVNAFFACGMCFSTGQKMPRLLGSNEEQGKFASFSAIVSKVIAIPISALGIWLVASMPTERAGMQVLLAIFAIINLLGALLVLIFFKPVIEDTAKEEPVTFNDIKQVLKVRNIWFIGLICFCIYLASSSLVYIQPYMVEFFGMSTTQSTTLGVIYKNFAIISAPICTVLGTKNKSKSSITKVIAIANAISALCFVFYLVAPTTPALLIAAIGVFLLASFWVMGAWAVMFVPVSEIRLPVRLTGTAIGICGVVGYLTDAFYFSLCGTWIDNLGTQGYSNIFILTVVCLAIAAILGFMVAKDVKAIKEKEEAELTV